MRTVTFTEFRKQASTLISEVARGEALVVIRHGKPVAEVVPFSGDSRSQPSWKRPGLRLETTGAELSAAILEERETDR